MRQKAVPWRFDLSQQRQIRHTDDFDLPQPVSTAANTFIDST
jgi:hypothetical protein